MHNIRLGGGPLCCSPLFAIILLVPPSGSSFTPCRPIFQANFNFDATPRWGTLRFQLGSFIYVARLGRPLISLLVRRRRRTGGAKKITEIVATPDSRQETQTSGNLVRLLDDYRLIGSTNGKTKARRTRPCRCAINPNTKRVSARGRCLEGLSRMGNIFSEAVRAWLVRQFQFRDPRKGTERVYYRWRSALARARDTNQIPTRDLLVLGVR